MKSEWEQSLTKEKLSLIKRDIVSKKIEEENSKFEGLIRKLNALPVQNQTKKSKSGKKKTEIGKNSQQNQWKPFETYIHYEAELSISSSSDSEPQQVKTMQHQGISLNSFEKLQNELNSLLTRMDYRMPIQRQRLDVQLLLDNYYGQMFRKLEANIRQRYLNEVFYPSELQRMEEQSFILKQQQQMKINQISVLEALVSGKEANEDLDKIIAQKQRKSPKKVKNTVPRLDFDWLQKDNSSMEQSAPLNDSMTISQQPLTTNRKKKGRNYYYDNSIRRKKSQRKKDDMIRESNHQFEANVLTTEDEGKRKDEIVDQFLRRQKKTVYTKELGLQKNISNAKNDSWLRKYRESAESAQNIPIQTENFDSSQIINQTIQSIAVQKLNHQSQMQLQLQSEYRNQLQEVRHFEIQQLYCRIRRMVAEIKMIEEANSTNLEMTIRKKELIRKAKQLKIKLNECIQTFWNEASTIVRH